MTCISSLSRTHGIDWNWFGSSNYSVYLGQKWCRKNCFSILIFIFQIYEYQGCQAAQDLLRGQEGETLLTANDQRSLNIRGRLFERFFSLLHVTNVASNGEHLNRECSLFTDDCRYVIVGSAVYVPEEPPPYFFEVMTPSYLVQIYKGTQRNYKFTSIVWLSLPQSPIFYLPPGVS